LGDQSVMMRVWIGSICTARVAAAFMLGPSLFSSRTMTSASSQDFIASSGDGNGGDGVVIMPSNGKHDSVVIFMHGLGDTAMGWASSMPELGLTTTKFVLPTAEERPISLNGGSSMPGWFDIFGLDQDSREDEAGFSESTRRIVSIIERESTQGVPLSKIAVCGFSQGGAMALHISLRYKADPTRTGDGQSSLAACAALSAWLPFRHEYPAALSGDAVDLPVLQCHGDEDMVVRYDWGRGSYDSLVRPKAEKSPPQDLGLGLRYAEWKEYRGMGHSACSEEITDLSLFLRAAFEK